MAGQDRITFTLDAWAVFDGTNEDEIQAVAGEQFISRDQGSVIVQGAGGRPERMEPGWAVYRVAVADGKPAARATVCSPEAWAGMDGPQTARAA